jgi:hypothetical protein
MKRWLETGLTVLLLSVSGGIALAGESEGPVYGGRLLRRHEEQSRKVLSEQLRLERAHIRARQRLEQEARYERLGYSPLRPYTNTAYWAMGLGTRGVR